MTDVSDAELEAAETAFIRSTGKTKTWCDRMRDALTAAAAVRRREVMPSETERTERIATPPREPLTRFAGHSQAPWSVGPRTRSRFSGIIDAEGKFIGEFLASEDALIAAAAPDLAAENEKLRNALTALLADYKRTWISEGGTRGAFDCMEEVTEARAALEAVVIVGQALRNARAAAPDLAAENERLLTVLKELTKVAEIDFEEHVLRGDGRTFLRQENAIREARAALAQHDEASVLRPQTSAMAPSP